MIGDMKHRARSVKTLAEAVDKIMGRVSEKYPTARFCVSESEYLYRELIIEAKVKGCTVGVAFTEAMLDREPLEFLVEIGAERLTKHISEQIA